VRTFELELPFGQTVKELFRGSDLWFLKLYVKLSFTVKHQLRLMHPRGASARPTWLYAALRGVACGRFLPCSNDTDVIGPREN